MINKEKLDIRKGNIVTIKGANNSPNMVMIQVESVQEFIIWDNDNPGKKLGYVYYIEGVNWHTGAFLYYKQDMDNGIVSLTDMGYDDCL